MFAGFYSCKKLWQLSSDAFSLFSVKQTVSAELWDKFGDGFALLKFTEKETGLK